MQTCPRRMHDFGPWERAENLDTWDEHPGLGMSGSTYRGCSFCGSLHPNDFMAAIKAGDIVGPTDKSYKAYIKHADQPSDYAKFYYQHLSNEQCNEFIELYNARQMAIGYPGHFYTMPYFCTTRSSDVP